MSLLTLQVNMAASGTVESEAKVTDIHEALHSDTLEGRGGSQHTSDLQVNMTASGTVESEANVTDIHEALHFDVLEEDSDDYFQRGFGIWSLSWAASGAEVVAGTGDDSLYLYNMDRQKVSTLQWWCDHCSHGFLGLVDCSSVEWACRA